MSVDATFGAGLPDADPAQTLEFLRAWHGTLDEPDERLISLLSLPSRRCLPLPLGRLIGQVATHGLVELIYPPAAVGADPGASPSTPPGVGVQNLYVSAATLATAPAPGRRGGRTEAGRSPGLWLDLDSDVGKFGSAEAVAEVEELLIKTGLTPAISVNTGSRGRHEYFKIKSGLEPDEVERLGRGLRLWLQQQTGTRIDSCENADRVLRLPGWIRWPKRGEEDTPPALCALLEVREAVHDKIDLEAFLADVLAGDDERRHAARERDLRDQEVAGQDFATLVGFDLGGEGWSGLYFLGHAEMIFNQRMTWDAILEPHGWSLNGAPDAEGRREWTRPGAGRHSDRSMITDWAESANVASLFSSAPETGLLRLIENEVAITKLRAYAELEHDGDLGRALWAWVEEHGDMS